jgi:hypothetical protein
MAETMNPLDELTSYMDVEEVARESLSVHWRAVFAGVFVTLITYFLLMSLGLAFGAGQVHHALDSQDGFQGVGAGAGLWLVMSVLVSLFAGSYASGRVSGIIATRVGYVQGAVVASIFFTLMLTQIGMAIGLVGAGLSGLQVAFGGVAGQALSSPRLMGIVEDSLGDLNLRAPIDNVASGLLTRALRGETESAVNYLALQSGISRAEAQDRFRSLNMQVRNAATDIAQRATEAARKLGWTAFAVILMGGIAAMLGGAIGAQMSLRKPMDRLDQMALKIQQSPAYP